MTISNLLQESFEAAWSLHEPQMNVEQNADLILNVLPQSTINTLN
jgi:hypothetical protein